MRRLAEEIERDVGERDVLLENWSVPTPLGEAMPENEPVVAEAKTVLEERIQNPFSPRGIL